MNIILQRKYHDKRTTIGELMIDGTYACLILEDEPREVKVHGETRIPAGRYRITLRTEGKFHEAYSKRFPEMHHGMLWIRDVPGFEYILIHCGNTDKDTEGCLITGSAIGTNNSVTGSTIAYKKTYPIITKEILAGRETFIDIKDEVKG